MSPEPITITYREDPALLREAMTAWARAEAKAKPDFWKKLGLSLLIGGAIGLAASLLDVDDFPQKMLWTLAGFLVGLVIWLGVAHHHQRKVLSLAMEGAEERGEVTAVLDSEGLRFSSGFGTSLTFWQGVHGVLALKAGTALRMGAVSYPIPDAALPPGLSGEEFRARIEFWRADA